MIALKYIPRSRSITRSIQMRNQESKSSNHLVSFTPTQLKSKVNSGRKRKYSSSNIAYTSNQRQQEHRDRQRHEGTIYHVPWSNSITAYLVLKNCLQSRSCQRMNEQGDLENTKDNDGAFTKSQPKYRAYKKYVLYLRGMFLPLSYNQAGCSHIRRLGCRCCWSRTCWMIWLVI